MDVYELVVAVRTMSRTLCRCHRSDSSLPVSFLLFFEGCRKRSTSLSVAPKCDEDVDDAAAQRSLPSLFNACRDINGGDMDVSTFVSVRLSRQTDVWCVLSRREIVPLCSIFSGCRLMDIGMETPCAVRRASSLVQVRPSRSRDAYRKW